MVLIKKNHLPAHSGVTKFAYTFKTSSGNLRYGDAGSPHLRCRVRPRLCRHPSSSGGQNSACACDGCGGRAAGLCQIQSGADRAHGALRYPQIRRSCGLSGGRSGLHDLRRNGRDSDADASGGRAGKGPVLPGADSVAAVGNSSGAGMAVCERLPDFG